MIRSQVDNDIGLRGDSRIGRHGESLKKLNKPPDICVAHDAIGVLQA